MIMMVAKYTYSYGSQLYGYGRWPAMRIMKLAYYTDNNCGQLNGYGRWPTIGIMKGPTIGIRIVANYTDMEGGQL